MLSFKICFTDANGLIKSYLTNRTQCVEMEGTSSDISLIFTGVRQGSILGPLLLLIDIVYDSVPKCVHEKRTMVLKRCGDIRGRNAFFKVDTWEGRIL